MLCSLLVCANCQWQLPNQKHRHLHSASAEFGVSLKRCSGTLVHRAGLAFSSLSRDLGPSLGSISPEQKPQAFGASDWKGGHGQAPLGRGRMHQAPFSKSSQLLLREQMVSAKNSLRNTERQLWGPKSPGWSGALGSNLSSTADRGPADVLND